MNWKEWLTFDFYKKLWSLIGGRPWTYIMRDIYHEAEWLIQMIWFFIGILIYHFFGWWGVLGFCIVYAFGYINGHLHWGTKWIKNQPGE
jgi:hypothetical protein